MKRDTFLSEIKEIELRRYGLLIGKSHDYATDDVLSNFKRMNILCKTLDIDVRRSPGDCARFLQVLKLDRKCNLLSRGVEPKNESIKDTVMDEHNYIDLAYGCDIE